MKSIILTLSIFAGSLLIQPASASAADLMERPTQEMVIEKGKKPKRYKHQSKIRRGKNTCMRKRGCSMKDGLFKKIGNLFKKKKCGSKSLL